MDPYSDVLYLYREYIRETDPAVHATAIRAPHDWIPGLVDLTANGRNQIDGSRLFESYRKLGLDLQFINNAEESGILNAWQRMNSGRLKVFPSLSKYLEERRLYRRDEKEQIVRDRDNLQDALRCLVNGISYMRTKPVKVVPPWPENRGPLGWMEM